MKPGGDEIGTPEMIPAIELKGSHADKLRTLDAAIVRLHELRRELAGDAGAVERPSELRGPYINTPVWPWFAAGWVLGALFVLLLLIARTYA